MKAVVLAGTGDVRVEEVEDARIVADTDALVEVHRTAICGADLFPFHGMTPGFENGTILGHEFAGVVSEVGDAVEHVRPGQRVVCTSTISDGTCAHCRAGRVSQCLGRALFGYSGVYPRLDGGQAEYVRVPHADRCLLVLPDDVDEENAIFLADILPTGYGAVTRGDVSVGDVVAVVGCVGAIAVTPDEAEGAVAEASDGLGADVVIEAAGSPGALDLALRLARGRGTISVVGAHFEPDYPLDSARMFERELTLRFTIGDPAHDRERLLGLIASGRLEPAQIITHRLPLDAAADAYRLFDSREATKVVLIP